MIVRPAGRDVFFKLFANETDRVQVVSEPDPIGDALMERLDIEGAWLYTPRIHHDERGSVSEWFSAREFAEAIGHPMPVAQANWPVTRRGAIRGVHYADVPPGQAKYITCVVGAILDVIVDVRVGSPTFGRSVTVPLDDQDRHAVYIGEGLGHAFMALTEETTVVYLCSTPYTPEREHGINPLDPALGIEWPAGIEPILSVRDAAAPGLLDAERSRALPTYRDWRDHCAPHHSPRYRPLRSH